MWYSTAGPTSNITSRSTRLVYLSSPYLDKSLRILPGASDGVTQRRWQAGRFMRAGRRAEAKLQGEKANVLQHLLLQLRSLPSDFIQTVYSCMFVRRDHHDVEEICSHLA